MKAEIEFVNSLPEPTMKNIQRAISGRVNEGLKGPKCTAVSGNYAISNFGIKSYTDYLCVSAIAPQQTKSLKNLCVAVDNNYNSCSKEDTMATETDTYKARQYLDGRLHNAKYPKRDALKQQYGLMDDDSPKTYAEVAERIKAGLFTLPSNEENFDSYEMFEYLRWRDPAKKEDRPGFDAAEKKLDAAATAVKDAIWVKANPEDALAALNAFEAATFN